MNVMTHNCACTVKKSVSSPPTDPNFWPHFFFIFPCCKTLQFMVLSTLNLVENYLNTLFLPSNVVFLCLRDHFVDKNELNVPFEV